jgi:uncharacterized repeat protein (TIGR01451 family)
MDRRVKSTILAGGALLLVLLVASSFALVSAAPGVDLQISKRATGLPGITGVVIAGEELIYEIDVYNSGDTTATNVVVSDTLPYEVMYLGSSPDVCTWTGSNPLVCDLGDMDPYEDRSFEVKVLVAPWAVMFEWDGTITMDNYAVVGSDETDDDPTDNADNISIFVEDSADLSVIKMSKPDTQVRAGELFTYTIYVENLGPSVSRFVGMRDNLLSSGDFELVDLYTNRDVLDDMAFCEVEASEPGISNTILCGLWFLEPKGLIPMYGPEELFFDTGQWIINVVLRANETQDVNNLVEVFPFSEEEFLGEYVTGTPDPDWSNNAAEDFIYVTDVADLGIDKWWEEAPSEWFDGAPFAPEDCYVYEGIDLVGVRAGCPLRYQIGVGNGGPSLAENVVVEDLLPAVVTVEGVGPSQGSCTTGIPGDPFAPLTCNLGYIPAGEGAGIEIFVMTDADLWGEVLENDAWVYSDIFDPDNGNNRTHVMMWADAFSYLEVQKQGPTDILAGEEIQYDIDVNNYGPSTAHNVHLDDELPGGVSLLGAEVMIGEGSCVPGTALCSLGDMEPWGYRHLRVRGLVDPGLEAGSLITNTVRVWADSQFFQPVPDQPISDTWETLVSAEANLSIVKTSEPMKIYPGEQKIYHIEVTNDGPTGAPGVVVTDTLPMEVDYEIDDGGCWLVSPDPDVLQCDLGYMMPGETREFSIWARVWPDAPPGQITNEAHVFMEEGYDPDEGNNWAYATNLVLEPIFADLELTKSILTPPPGPPFFAGNDIRFQLDVYNHGPVAAENVVLEDMLPEGVTVVNVNPSQGSCTTGDPGSTPLTCNLGTLGVDGSATVLMLLNIDPDYMGSLENDAVVSSDIYDPDNSNNRDYVIVQVSTRADLYLDKEAPPPYPWTAGEVRTYRYNIGNDGPSVSRDVRLRDFLPEEVEFVSAYAFEEGSTGGIPLPCNVSAANVLICPLGDIPPTDPPGVAVLVDVFIKPDVPDGTWIYNEADLISDTTDPGGAWDDVGMEIRNEADLSVWKDAEPWKVYAGEQVMYTIELTNNGPGDSYSVLMTDTLPSGVLAELVTDPACVITGDFTGEEVDCYWDVLPVGQTKTFYIFGRVEPDAEPGTVSNGVDVWSEVTEDPVDYNDYASAPILIQGRADLMVQKFGKPEGEVRAGDELTYTVRVYNLGTGYAHEVTLDDVLNSDGSFDLLGVTSDRDALCDPETGTFDHEMSLTCTLSDTLEVKGPEPGSGRWELTVVVLANEPQDMNNVAYVAGADYDPDLSNNSAMAEHEITAVADLELVKQAWGEMLVGCEGETELWLDEVAAGNTVTYTLAVTNTGPSTAENVTVLDEPLPYPDLLNIDVESIEPSQGECLTADIVDERRLSCNLGTLAPDMTATVTFVASVPSWVPDYTVLVNDALVYSDMSDDNNGNDLYSNQTIVSRVADLEVIKTQDPEISLPTWDITYTITVTNLGPSDVEGLFISDTIPVQVLDPVMTCCASDDGECDIPCEPPTCPEEPCPWPDIVFFAQADIPAGEWAIYTVNGTLDWWPCGPFTNTVTLIPPESLTHPPEDIDPCDENNTDIAVNDPVCHFDPLVLKSFPGPDSTD